MASSSSAISVTREEFNAFHMIDRALFARLVLTLRRDISQSFQVMSFLLYLEISGLARNLIAKLVSSSDHIINEIAQEVAVCLSCLSYQDFATFAANSGQNINSFAIPWITRIAGAHYTLALIHQNRETILLEMNKQLTGICYRAFDDICLRAKMNNEEMEKTMEMMNQLGISNAHKVESSEAAKIQSGVDAAFSENEQVMAEARTVFLTFSKGYPISEAEVYDHFTGAFGDIIEAIYMPGGVGNEQALYARLVLRSSDKIAEIVKASDGIKTKYTINGKHVWARKFIPKYSNNLPPASGGSL